MATDKKEFIPQKGCLFLYGVYRQEEGYNFTVEAPEEAKVSLLLYKKGHKAPYAEIPFTGDMQQGCMRSMFLKGIEPSAFSYNYSIDGEVVQDIWAHQIIGHETFGALPGKEPHDIRCGFLPEEAFDWGEASYANVPLNEMILYKLHVRGFTRAAQNVKNKGTFAGLREMIPYFKELGINAIELMPAYETFEVAKPQGESGMVRETVSREKVNYWGYIPGYYMAPKSAYAATKDPVREMRELVRELHRAGIACIMEFYFTEGRPIYTAFRVLQFWRDYYHIDGFHVHGDGFSRELICQDGFLSRTLLFLDSPVPPGSCRAGERTAVYDGEYKVTMRRLLKSDEGMVSAAMQGMFLEKSGNRIHAITTQDGFTLKDLVSYNYRHNEANGEGNRDGSSFNYSWNCGVEGPTRKGSIREAREKQIRNAFLLMLLSQGIPMIYAGDEFGNSQDGNNNAWCQDNPVGWTDWKARKKVEGDKVFQFVRSLIAFRKEHPILSHASPFKESDYLAVGAPDISFHGERAFYVDRDNSSRMFGVMLREEYAGDGHTGALYIGFNFHWEESTLALPAPPEGYAWVKACDSAKDSRHAFDLGEEAIRTVVTAAGRSVVVLKTVPLSSLRQPALPGPDAPEPDGPDTPAAKEETI